VLKEGPHGNVDAELVPDTCDRLDHKQRVPAQLEEIVVDPDVTDP
jgi:hypothetical protein